MLDSESTSILGSAGKFITHIAALKLVEQGAITLDEPIFRHLLELESLPLITLGSGNEQFSFSPVTKKITLRHLLSHTSGLASDRNPPISEYLSSDVSKIRIEPDTPPIVKRFSMPLIFEPGEGIAYDHSTYWTQLPVYRLGENSSTDIFRSILLTVSA
ncbi:beta-lactamase/transpeptidase-like protein [Talaromyces proteolyticus]|uniref:Beta-lactamase/transpeptidase-like protein n=1 Tax=Talaromyces proteolyticus TaxID=1131652 RepID=A0AAD4PX87_9EURO|nr:beta-lactamase/transpeptidase-like protein [Talaromyces proteolyticus]KAH8696124.1 beta-lactamase/transpeptidase-like protein [Talaromyces proteolyticus]